jgi:phospholipase A1
MNKQKPRICKGLNKQLLVVFFVLTGFCIANASYGEESAPPKPAIKSPNGDGDVLSLIQSANGLSMHKEMYLLPITVADKYNGSQTEMEFQISGKAKILNSRFYFGYTQKSFWQAYDFSNSSPFRETNYNPEIFYRTGGTSVDFGKWEMDIGFEHESNGQSGATSRSWNRLYIAPYLPRRDSLWYWKLWYRIPVDIGKDDNPDILDYMGYGELHYKKRFAHGQLIHAMLRCNASTGYGAISINYSIPGPSDNYFYLIRLFSGYGESLIDYNHEVNRIGFGIIIAR